jgi:hypothetical protein
LADGLVICGACSSGGGVVGVLFAGFCTGEFGSAGFLIGAKEAYNKSPNVLLVLLSVPASFGFSGRAKNLFKKVLGCKTSGFVP